jgi:hypothetical protein
MIPADADFESKIEHPLFPVVLGTDYSVCILQTIGKNCNVYVENTVKNRNVSGSKKSEETRGSTKNVSYAEMVKRGKSSKDESTARETKVQQKRRMYGKRK